MANVVIACVEVFNLKSLQMPINMVSCSDIAYDTCAVSGAKSIPKKKTGFFLDITLVCTNFAVNL